MTGMDAVPREILRAAYQRKHIYLLKVVFDFALWGALVATIWATKDHPQAILIAIACSLPIGHILRGLGVVGHDAVHGTLLENKALAYLLGLLCWSPSTLSVTLYANYHLHHHKIVNTYPDIDNFVVTDYTRSPTIARLILFVVYTFGYPFYFMRGLLRYVPRLSAWEKVRMTLELALIFGGLYLVIRGVPFHVFLFGYGLPFLYGVVVTAVSAMIEHFDMPASDDDAYTARTYGTRSVILNFFWNGASFHMEHHKYPGIPWYNLKRFHEAAYPYYNDQLKAQCYPGVLAAALLLYKRILKFDIAKLDAQYRTINSKVEREKSMAVPGIPGAV